MCFEVRLIFFFFLWPRLWHMELPRLGVESELQMLSHATATATPVLSRICDLSWSLWQAPSLTHWPRPGIEPMPSRALRWVLKLLSHNGNSDQINLNQFFLAISIACGSSWARDWTLTTAATRATTVTSLDL